MKASTPSDELICRFLNDRATEAEARWLEDWRRSDPANDRHFRSMARLLSLTEAVPLAASPVPTPRATLREVVHPSGGGATVREERRMVRHWSVRRWAATGAAAAAIAAIAFVSYLVLGGTPRVNLGEGVFATGRAERATLALGDGTVVRLAPESRLRILESERDRAVFLDGRAYFAVAEMKDYPFRVHTRAGEARVLGTRFEVLARARQLRVVVTEGRVELDAGVKRVEVAAGYISRIREGTVAAPTRVEDPYALVDWLGPFLVFDDAPLTEVAVELERAYGVDVVLADSSLSELRVTGWYADRTLDEVLTLVCGAVQLRCPADQRRVLMMR